MEDDPDLRGFFVTLLQHHGYVVLEATDGVTGIRLARERLPDAVLMDINLPRISGLTATEVLKQHRETAAIPVLAISACAPSPSEVLLAGCRILLDKPVPPQRLLDEIERAIEAT